MTHRLSIGKRTECGLEENAQPSTPNSESFREQAAQRPTSNKSHSVATSSELETPLIAEVRNPNFEICGATNQRKWDFGFSISEL
jgi:hypothetical protein